MYREALYGNIESDIYDQNERVTVTVCIKNLGSNHFYYPVANFVDDRIKTYGGPARGDLISIPPNDEYPAVFFTATG